MNKTIRNLIAAILILILAISSLPVAFAAEETALWASPITNDVVEETRPISAVKWWYDETDAVYYLFMPSACDTTAMQVWLDGAESCTIDDLSFADGATISLLTPGDHTVVINDVTYPVTVMQSANIGTMYITTESGNMDYIHKVKGNKESGYMKMLNADGDVVYDNTLSEIKGRGNATWSRPKKPYQIKLSKKTDLTGDAGKNKTWILLANYLERSMMRNSIIYDMAYEAGLTNSCLSTYVDLYCNGEYRGTYQLTEKVHINDDRIEINNLEDTTQDVNELDLEDYPTFGPANASVAGSRKGYEIPNNPDDITGGYLLELDHSDRYTAEASGFVTTRGQAVVIKEPEYASREQVNYIANYFQEFEDAVFSDDGICPTTGKYYYEYFDLTSLARKYIIEEISKNIDADVTSQYYYKPSDTESTVGYCGPVWDYDNALGNYISGDSLDGNDLYAASKKNYIYKNLYKKESFLNAVYAEWENNYKPLMEMTTTEETAPADSELRTIDEYYEMLTASAAMNFTYWENINSVDTANYNDTGDTYQEHVEFVRDFLIDRTKYLDSIWCTDSIMIKTSTVSEQEAVESDFVSIQNYNGNAATYTIANEADLQKMADLISAGNSFSGITLLQTADITLTKQFTPSTGGTYAANISPGNYAYCFKGTYNGQGYKIHNLQIENTQGDGVGIFGLAYGATFMDMHIASGSVIGDNRVGAIAGYGDKCTFIRCSNGADIYAYNVGSTDGSAGLAGVSRGGAVFTSCYNTGSVSAKAAAGITGWAQGNATLTNCWNIGIIDGRIANKSAALARNNDTICNYSTCYYYTACGESDQNGATSADLAQFADGTVLAGLNATSDIWEQGADTPVLKTPERVTLIPVTTNRYAADALISTQVSFLNTAGNLSLPTHNDFINEIKINGVTTTESTVYVSEETTIDIYMAIDGVSIKEFNGTGNYFLSDGDDLNTLLELSRSQTLSGSNFFLLADVDAGGFAASGGSFGGTLNGFYATVKNLSIPLFEEITTTGELRKITFKGGNIDADGIVLTNQGRISDITTQDIVLYGHHTGGIVGTNSGELTNCTVSNGYVIGHQSAAGIAAINNGTIKNCINHASIVSVQSVVAGISANNVGVIESCINVGMLYGGTCYAIASRGDADSFYWDWCVGEGDATALTDAEIADTAMLENLSDFVWTEGKKFPSIIRRSYEIGDANGDHLVGLADVLRILRYFNGLIDADEINLTAADMNGDGFSMPDAIRLLKYLKGVSAVAELPAEEAANPYTIKIVDYNIRTGNDGTNKQIADRAPRLLRIIEEYQPDIIGLQEAVPEWIAYIEENMTDEYTLFYKYRAESSLECTPILYKTDKYNELDKGYFWLSETPDVESKSWDASYYRICNWVKLEDKATGEIFLFYNTHYDFTDSFREGASNLIINHATEQGGFTEYPVLLSGDFNMGTTDNGYEVLVNEGPFENINGNISGRGYDYSATFGGYNPYTASGIIDFIFYSPDLLTPNHYEILDDFILGGYVSDHNGIYAEVTIPTT